MAARLGLPTATPTWGRTPLPATWACRPCPWGGQALLQLGVRRWTGAAGASPLPTASTRLLAAVDCPRTARPPAQKKARAEEAGGDLAQRLLLLEDTEARQAR